MIHQSDMDASQRLAFCRAGGREMSIQRKLNERERMAYASIARLEQEREALAAQRDEGLAREAELQIQIAQLRKTWTPHFCGIPMAKNLHPEAGIPGKYLEVGAVYECIPCLVASRHSWATKSAALQQLLAEAEKLLRETLEFYDDGVGRDDEHGNHIEWDFWQKIHAYFASPGCADGEKS